MSEEPLQFKSKIEAESSTAPSYYDGGERTNPFDTLAPFDRQIDLLKTALLELGVGERATVDMGYGMQLHVITPLQNWPAAEQARVLELLAQLRREFSDDTTVASHLRTAIRDQESKRSRAEQAIIEQVGFAMPDLSHLTTEGQVEFDQYLAMVAVIYGPLPAGEHGQALRNLLQLRYTQEQAVSAASRRLHAPGSDISSLQLQQQYDDVAEKLNMIVEEYDRLAAAVRALRTKVFLADLDVVVAQRLVNKYQTI